MAPLRAVLPVHTICARCLRQQRALGRRLSTTSHLRYAEESNLPRIATTSFWASLIPKPFRRPTDTTEIAERTAVKAQQSKEWNPATIFLILGILVGSNAIQIIALRNEMLNFSRKTDAKLSLLREIVQRVKNGEDVDVQRALGTGDPQHEAEWEEVIKELQETDMLAESKKKREAKRLEKAEQRSRSKAESLEASEREGPRGGHGTDAEQPANDRRPKFLM